MDIEFEAKPTWVDGVVGITKLGSASEVKFALPKVFGGEEGYAAPEELLLSALATCLCVVTWRILSKKSIANKS